ARHRDAQGTEGTAQEPAPGRRGARLLDQGGEYRPDSLPRGFAWARRFLPEAPQAAAFGMNARIVGVLVVLLIALGGGALLVREQQSAPRSADAGALGQPLLKGLQASQVATIVIRQPKGAITIAKKDERWT